MDITNRTHTTSQMPVSSLIPAAQYLRMSTERQEYSHRNQCEAIARYAESHGFTVIQAYSDPAISGVLLRKRKGLQKLIQDVAQGNAPYKAILVYDVSRWGRFQDTDESAHYEFLCKSAGVPVHYCAEMFVNDDALPNMIMKSLKRAMAREYVRELGAKVTAGQRRGAALGFRQGGQPGYGFRRLLVSADKTPKQILVTGERKSVATDRTILVPGPNEEVRWVQEIYRMFIKKRMTFSQIARELNRRCVVYIEGSKWSLMAVENILTHPKYIGCNIYGRYTQRLYTPPTPRPRSEWTITPGAFEPLVSIKTFEAAQRIIQRANNAYPRHRTNAELLDALRGILARKGRITTDFVESVNTYRQRFGSVSKAYELIGYRGFWRNGWLETRRRIQMLRNELMANIVSHDPAHISVEKRGYQYRSRLQIDNQAFVSVIASRPFYGYKDDLRWLLLPRPDESHLTTLIARLNPECTAFKDMFVIPPLGEAVAVYLKDNDPRLQSASRLTDLSTLRHIVERLLNANSFFPRHLSRPDKYVRRSLSSYRAG